MKDDMPIDENTKGKIMDQYFNQHKTIREIAKIAKKSSRDVIAAVKEGEDNHDDNKNNVNQEKEDCKNPPLNTKAYRLYSQGLTPLRIALGLGLPEAEATKFYMEYLRLTHRYSAG